MSAATVITMRPAGRCATANCVGRARPMLEGYCEDCFGWYVGEAESKRLAAEARTRRRAWLGGLRAWPWILGAIAIEWLLIYEAASAAWGGVGR